ncbi:GGDEF domain-containing protein [Paenibacillus sp. SYP-B3998]|uniref:GGDEF domain-containing protein n=1 Tax=Paenibacillus sp. SYP-B3998 TaxID=2678564 RepID=A0A6G4A4L4_9BACL|nr:GGDEF domain-containing protein [Paenibacillus sp. SYP-B3998]NEW09270.1 GGDEF domain-containing protein [Paenibacillus sp. SYP-B3998]
MEQLPVNDNIWNRKLIHILWWILLIYEVAAMLGFFFGFYNQPDHWFNNFMEFQVLPTCLQLILMAFGYIAIASFKKYSDFIMIVWTLIMLSIFLITIPELRTKYELLAVPIILSSVYFKKKPIIFAYSLGLLCLVGLISLNLYRGIPLTPNQVIVPVTVITATAFVCFAIMNKGIDLIHLLKDSVVREQELLIRNVMIDRLSKMDALTELFNHRSFQEHTDHLISHMPYDTPLELALMDIDNFKNINDTYGHWVGDVVLKTIGITLKEVLGTDDMAFRYGGEEFAVLFVGKNHEEVLALCEQLMQTIRDTEVPEMPGHQLTMSIGLATYNRNTMKKAWFQLVDECLYMAKRSGKNQIYAHMTD